MVVESWLFFRDCSVSDFVESHGSLGWVYHRKMEQLVMKGKDPADRDPRHNHSLRTVLRKEYSNAFN